MSSYMHVVVVGNLGQDPELRYLPSGNAVVNPSVAVTEVWNDRTTNERRERTTWIRGSIFGKQAETFAKYTKKGDKVLLEGTPSASAYIDKDGNAVAVVELRVNNFRFLERRGTGSQQDTQDDSDRQPEMDDIPF